MTRKIVIAAVKYRNCKHCGEHAPYDVHTDYIDPDNSDERHSFFKCRLCGKDTPYASRMTKKKIERNSRSAEMNKLMEELLHR